MLKLSGAIAAALLLATPASAADWQYQGSDVHQGGDVRRGAFFGARVKMSLGGQTRSRPHAALALAPMQSRISSGGTVRTHIGEGVALKIGAKPTLTFAGARADQVLGIGSSKGIDAKRKLGVSTGGWIAIGVGAVAIVGGLYFVHLVEEIEENSE